MMHPIEQFAYTTFQQPNQMQIYRPIVPVKLALKSQLVVELGLVDSGAPISILPYTVGLNLGLIWDQQMHVLEVAGAFGTVAARAVALQTGVGNLPPVGLVFAWVETDNAPLILGNVSFFMEFDVLFKLSKMYFQVSPKT
jgi:hypothetical protein